MRLSFCSIALIMSEREPPDDAGLDDVLGLAAVGFGGEADAFGTVARDGVAAVAVRRDVVFAAAVFADSLLSRTEGTGESSRGAQDVGILRRHWSIHRSVRRPPRSFSCANA